MLAGRRRWSEVALTVTAPGRCGGCAQARCVWTLGRGRPVQVARPAIHSSAGASRSRRVLPGTRLPYLPIAARAAGTSTRFGLMTGIGQSDSESRSTTTSRTFDKSMVPAWKSGDPADLRTTSCARAGRCVASSNREKDLQTVGEYACK